MRIFSFTAALLACGTAATACGADLTKLDRTLNKEPAYQGKPTYCLLVFGQEAKTRVWLVFDGKALYIDRNGNGDLTEKGELASPERPGAMNWHIGDIVEADGRSGTRTCARGSTRGLGFCLYEPPTESTRRSATSSAGCSSRRRLRRPPSYIWPDP